MLTFRLIFNNIKMIVYLKNIREISKNYRINEYRKTHKTVNGLVTWTFHKIYEPSANYITKYLFLLVIYFNNNGKY